MATQSEISTFIREEARVMVEFVRDKFGAPGFSPKVEISFSERNKRSRGGIRGGEPFIKICALRFLKAANSTGIADFREYKSFNSNSVIGGLFNVSWKTALRCLVAHEIAHAVQYDCVTRETATETFGLSALDSDSAAFNGHNIFWRKIYAALRVRFINSNIEKPKPLDPTPLVVPPLKEETKKPNLDALMSKYRYKGNSVIVEYYLYQKLVAIVAQIGKEFYKVLGDETLELLPCSTLAASRRYLIGV